MKNILILCTGNSCRSQIAHGYFELFANNRANIFSAGIETWLKQKCSSNYEKR